MSICNRVQRMAARRDLCRLAATALCGGGRKSLKLAAARRGWRRRQGLWRCCVSIPVSSRTSVQLVILQVMVATR